MKMLKKIKKNSMPILTLSLILGIVLPQAGGIIKPYILLLLVAAIFFVGLKVNLKETARSLRNPKPLLFLLFISAVIMPAFYYVLAAFMIGEMDIVIGFVLLGSTSVAISSSVWTLLAGGDVKLPLSTTVVNMLMIPVSLPLTVYLIFQKSIEFDIFGTFITLVLTVAVPLFAGYWVKKTREESAEYAHLSILPLAVITYVITALNAGKILTMSSLLVILILFLKIISCAFLALLFSKKLKKDPASVFFSMTTKNRSVASAVALSSFTELTALPMTLSTIVDTVANMVAVRFFRKNR